MTKPPARHTITIVAAPKMDAHTLVAAECSCGTYRGGPTSARSAEADGWQHVAAATINDAAAILDAGLAWLFDTTQPDDAISQHHGTTRATPDRIFGFVPRGFSGAGAIITMDLAHPDRDQRGDLTNTLTPYDVHALADALRRRGQTIANQWNGVGTETVSIQVQADAHPTLLAVVDRYKAGCPVHNSVFCSLDGRACDWYATGRAKLIDPTWAAAAEETI